MSTVKQSTSTKQIIRQTAERLFRERGYAAVGLREIAKAVGIEAPSIYNHYKSKDDILREICFDMAKQFFIAFDASAATEDKSTKRLKAVMVAHINVISNNIEAAEVFFNEWVFLEQPHLGRFKKLRYEYEMKFRSIIDNGVKSGDFKMLNSKLTAFVIFSALNATYELYHTNEKLTIDQIATNISELLLKGLKA